MLFPLKKENHIISSCHKSSRSNLKFLACNETRFLLWKFSHNVFITYLINIYLKSWFNHIHMIETWKMEGSGSKLEFYCTVAMYVLPYIINGAMLHENNFNSTTWLFLARYIRPGFVFICWIIFGKMYLLIVIYVSD